MHTARIDYRNTYRWLRDQVSHRGMTEQQRAVTLVLCRKAGQVIREGGQWFVQVYATVREVREGVMKALKRTLDPKTLRAWLRGLMEKWGLVQQADSERSPRPRLWRLPVPDRVILHGSEVGNKWGGSGESDASPPYTDCPSGAPSECAGGGDDGDEDHIEKTEAIRKAYPGDVPVQYARRLIRVAVKTARADGYTGDVYADMLAGAKRYAKSQQVADGFQMNLANWLEQGGWTRDYAPAKGVIDTDKIEEDCAYSAYSRAHKRQHGVELGRGAWEAMGSPRVDTDNKETA